MAQVSGVASRTTDNREAAERFAQARVGVHALWPFMAGAVMRLCPRWTREVDTVAVDGQWRLYLNPDWVAKQHPAMLALILAGHELQHCLGNHSVRLSDLNGVWIESGAGRTTVANAAHDLAINSGLRAFVDAAEAYQTSIGRHDRIKLVLPKEALYPWRFHDKRGKPFPIGLMSEQYADLLMAEAAGVKMCHGPGEPDDADGSSGGPGGGRAGEPKAGAGKPKAGADKTKAPACGKCGSGGGGARGAYEDPTEADPDDPGSGVCEIERETIKTRVAQEIRDQSARMKGTVPGAMELWADVYLKRSKVPWHKIFRRAVRSAVNRLAGQYDYSYVLPHRRTLGSRVIFPGTYRPDPEFVAALDTSGSMQRDDYAETFGHLASILASVGYRKVPVFTCDSAAHEIQMVKDVSQIVLRGGGGTDMGVAIAKAVESGYKLVLVMTDGETSWPARMHGVTVIAVLTRRPSAMPPDWITTVVQD